MSHGISLSSALSGLVLCCCLSTAPVRGGEPVRVIPAVRHASDAESETPEATTVGWRHFAHRAYRHRFHGHYHGWGPGIRRYGFYRSYPGSFYYGGYAPYDTYSAPVYRTTWYAPTYVSPTVYAPSYTVFSYRPLFYYAPSVRVLYGGYGYYYPGCY